MTGFGFARLALLLPLMFGVIFADKSCDIDLGDIGDLVVQYEVTVTNTGPEEVRIGVYGGDVKATAIVPAGGAVGFTSYQGGGVTIYAEPAVDAVAELKSRKVDIETQLSQKPLSLTVATQLVQELEAINNTLRDTSQTHSGACFTRLQPDTNGKGQDYDFDAVKEGNAWKVTGSCAF